MSHILKQINSGLNRGMAVMAATCLLAMVFVTVGEMVLRVLSRPMAGIVEVIGWLAAATTAFALGYTQLHKGHVAISLLTDLFGLRTQAMVAVVVELASCALFAFTAWHVFWYGESLRAAGSLSETMRIIDYPWVYLVAVGCGSLALSLLVDLLDTSRSLIDGTHREG